MLAWELTGAVVGAGMASGREIATFFARYGRWGIVGILLSIAMMVFLADVSLPDCRKHSWINIIWRLLQSLLLVCTGGAMLSGGGEIAALVLPVSRAYSIGVIVTIVLGCLLARHTLNGLALVSKMLLAVLVITLIFGLYCPPSEAVSIDPVRPINAVLRGITYGGFNAALQAPIMSRTTQIPSSGKKRAARLSGLIVGSVLILGYTVLMRQPGLLHEALPFVVLQSRYGLAGYLLASLCLYLAIISTLTACLRCLNSTPASLAAILLVSSLGLSGVIEIAYPLLGGSCFLILLGAKLVNCLIPPFHSRKNMI